MNTATELTREQILEMPAGRELDEMVAERIVGWQRGNLDAGERPWFPPLVSDRHGGFLECPPYSGSIAAAWQVVEKFQGWSLKQCIDPDTDKWFFVCLFFGMRVYEGIGETAPLAICRAALLTKLRDTER